MDNTPNKMLEHIVVALGGSKQVAPLIWPEKGIAEAQRLLCDCLNDERPAKLDFAQVLFILRLARDRGIHHGMDYICTRLSYGRTEPIAPRDEADDLRRKVLEMGRELQDALSRIEAISTPKKARA